jgi:hypothetical protein
MSQSGRDPETGRLLPGHTLGGRPPGPPSGSHAELRKKLSAFAERHYERIDQWLLAAAEKNPADAFRLYLDLCEFCLPKLARIEATGEDGGPLVVNILRFKPEDARDKPAQ